MFFDMIFLGFSLGIDAFFVALSMGFASQNNKKEILLFCVFAGLFQFIMPVIGYFVTYFFSTQYIDFIQQIDHFLVLIVFSYLAYKLYSEDFQNDVLSLSFLKLVLLSVATSIDALGAGLMIFSLDYNIFISAFIILIITFFMCFCSFLFFGIFSKINSKYLKIIGVVLLFFLGLKTFINHIILEV